MSSNYTRTIYEAYATAVQRVGIPFQMMPKSTLNEKLDIQANVPPATGTYPNIGYLAVGIGGLGAKTGVNNLFMTEKRIHDVADSALFAQVPFLIRPINNDIDSGARSRYALRKVINVNGVDYIAYYLLRIVKDGVVAGTFHVATVNDVVSTLPFVPDTSNQNPTPITLSNTGVNIPSGDYLYASVPTIAKLNASDVSELINAITILYGTDYAIISEAVVCSGQDLSIQIATANGGSAAFNEAICVQPSIFINTNYPLDDFRDFINIPIDLGVTEPLGAIQSV